MEHEKNVLISNTILRCQHIKINGTSAVRPPCARPSIVYYHIHYYWRERKLWKTNGVSPDAAHPRRCKLHPNVAGQDDRALGATGDRPKAAALVLYALQTASMNLKTHTLEPKLPTQVVIDRQSVARRPLGASAWSRVEGREYDDLTAESDDKSIAMHRNVRKVLQNSSRRQAILRKSESKSVRKSDRKNDRKRRRSRSPEVSGSRYPSPSSLLRSAGDDVEQVADYGVVGDLEDWGFGIFVDGYDAAGAFHADDVLDRSGDA